MTVVLLQVASMLVVGCSVLNLVIVLIRVVYRRAGTFPMWPRFLMGIVVSCNRTAGMWVFFWTRTIKFCFGFSSANSTGAHQISSQVGAPLFPPTLIITGLKSMWSYNQWYVCILAVWILDAILEGARPFGHHFRKLCVTLGGQVSKPL